MGLLDSLDRAIRDARLDVAARRLVIREGLSQADARLQEAPEDPETLAVKGLLLRLWAEVEPDRELAPAFLAEADALRDRATRARKRRLAGL